MIKVSGNCVIKVSGNFVIKVKGKLVIKVSGKFVIKVSGEFVIKVNGNFVMRVILWMCKLLYDKLFSIKKNIFFFILEKKFLLYCVMKEN